jgi:amidase
MPPVSPRSLRLPPSRALFLAVLLLLACQPGDAAPTRRFLEEAFPLLEMSVSELQAGMASGRFTAREITVLYLDRIEDLDQRGPELRSILALDPQALAHADSLDQERAAGRVRGPLHGIPILLKDNIGTRAPLPTTAGSLALESVLSPEEAFLARRLREEGAILLGKANLSEWANFRSTRSSSGWSGVGGQTRNPYVLDRSPCGSSSGSGVAVSANLIPVAVGTETDGSVVCPASVNGLVGIKPTVGLVSRSGIVPLSLSQDTAGPMARTVADAAILLTAMAGEDPADPATRSEAEEGRGGRADDYTVFLNRAALGGARIGVIRSGMTGYHPPTDALFDQALADLLRAGAQVIDDLSLPHFGTYGDAEFTILLHEFKEDLNLYLGQLGPDSPVRSLDEVVRFNQENADRSMPHFGQELFEAALRTEGRGAAEYQAAVERARMARVGIHALMDELDLDALVAPTTTPAWPIDLVLGDHYLGASSSPAAVSGNPNITVPMGKVGELPVGISFFGRAWSEPTLIGLAFAYEQATLHRTPPRFLSTALQDP